MSGWRLSETYSDTLAVIWDRDGEYDNPTDEEVLEHAVARR